MEPSSFAPVAKRHGQAASATSIDGNKQQDRFRHAVLIFSPHIWLGRRAEDMSQVLESSPAFSGVSDDANAANGIDGSLRIAVYNENLMSRLGRQPLPALVEPR